MKNRARHNSKILLYNKFWGMRPDKEYNYRITDGFELTTEHRYMDEAVAVVFHMPTLKKDDRMLQPGMKRKGQYWVFWSMESEMNYRWQYAPEIMNLFDIEVTYRLNSHIPTPYLYANHAKRLKRRPDSKKELVNAFISSHFNQSSRMECLSELMSCIDVHSYGKLLNNRSLKKDKGEMTKLRIQSRYKFSLAFENAIAKDYVTEKFFDPLVAGSIPVYLGAPNIEEFAPGDHCYIDASRFSSMKELAAYLTEISNDDKMYNEFMKWKKLPFRKGFDQKLSMVEKAPLVRLCNLLSDYRR